MTPYCGPDIQADEGLRLKAYQDTLGVWTCGWGHAGVAPGAVWTMQRAEDQFAIDLRTAVDGLNSLLPWWKNLNDPRQDVLVNMAFQLGVHGLLGFRNALTDIRDGAYASAKQDMLSSPWARETPARAERLAKQMASGVRA